ncbi:hypothetical protein C2E23DRAFT_258522 [Lenzites betulinus]|nr:hypothetical protein C2E23DRAFT_258522 [Lenzites betulinus]
MVATGETLSAQKRSPRTAHARAHRAVVLAFCAACPDRHAIEFIVLRRDESPPPVACGHAWRACCVKESRLTVPGRTLSTPRRAPRQSPSFKPPATSALKLGRCFAPSPISRVPSRNPRGRRIGLHLRPPWAHDPEGFVLPLGVIVHTITSPASRLRERPSAPAPRFPGKYLSRDGVADAFGGRAHRTSTARGGSDSDRTFPSDIARIFRSGSSWVGRASRSRGTLGDRRLPPTAHARAGTTGPGGELLGAAWQVARGPNRWGQGACRSLDLSGMRRVWTRRSGDVLGWPAMEKFEVISMGENVNAAPPARDA